MTMAQKTKLSQVAAMLCKDFQHVLSVSSTHFCIDVQTRSQRGFPAEPRGPQHKSLELLCWLGIGSPDRPGLQCRTNVSLMPSVRYNTANSPNTAIHLLAPGC